MNKLEFLSELERQLSEISSDERENALLYYKNYIDDAGPENEQEIIAGLNSPQEIASEIKRDLGFIEVKKMNKGKPFFEKTIRIGKSQMPLWVFILILFVTVPVWLPIVSSLLGAVLSIFFTVVGIAIGIFAGALGLIIGGIGLIVGGIAALISQGVFTGLFILGLGLLLIGIGILLFMLSIQIFFVWIPQFIKWVQKTIKRPIKNNSLVEKGEIA